jgi:hypothetical protein
MPWLGKSGLSVAAVLLVLTTQAATAKPQPTQTNGIASPILRVARLAGPAAAMQPASLGLYCGLPTIKRYRPSFYVDPGLYGVNMGVAPAHTGISFCALWGATAKVVFLAPRGVSIRLEAAPGTILGWLSAKAQIGRTLVNFAAGAQRIVAADPARYLKNRCAPGRHDAVWLLRTTGTNRSVSIALPLYVDEIVPHPANGGSVYRLQLCFGSANERRRIPGWPAHAVFRLMNLHLEPGVLSERPSAPAAYLWHGLFTPFRTNGSPNAAAVVESRATQLLPVVWTLEGTYDAAAHAARLSGMLMQGPEPIRTLQFVIWSGTSLKAEFPGIANAQTTAATSDSAGHFSASVPIATATYFRISGGTVLQYVDGTGCAPPSIAPKGCVSASQSGFATASAIVKVGIP